MNIKEKALEFAVKAHNGQVRKAQPDKPMIMHPITTANILDEYHADDDVIAAGYLHDVVEDTPYTIEDIKKEFGEDIAMLVDDATEPDKELSWEERKQDTIDYARNLPLRRKLVICADKISNLEDTMILFQKNGEKDFSSFKRGEEKQKWYYTNIYKSLINNEDENLPMFKRLKNAIDIVFYNKEDTYLKDIIFDDNLDYYLKLKQLHAQKQELKNLKELCPLSKPFIVEFCGTPRTGKTSAINNIYDFFKKGGFNTKIISEFTTSPYYKNEFKKKFQNYSDLNIPILIEVQKQLLEASSSFNDVVLIDRSLNDRQIWNHRRYTQGIMDEKVYLEARKKALEESKKLIDYLVITYTTPLESLKRDYNSSLSLEKRNFLNLKNIGEYNDSLNALNDLLCESTNGYSLIDTTDIGINDTTTKVAEDIMPVMRKKYIDTFKKKYNIK